MADQSQSQQIPLEELVDDLAGIRKLAFKATVGVFFGLSILSILARAGIRLRTRRALTLDDYLLFAAAVFLSGGTGLMYTILDNLYLATAIQLDPTIVLHVNSGRLMSLLMNATQQNHAFLMIAWTATFLVKFSFLAFFRQLIWNVTGIRRYYWVVVGVTVVSWLFLISEPFILCSDFGLESIKCFDESKDFLYISMTGLITGLDALTDIMSMCTLAPIPSPPHFPLPPPPPLLPHRPLENNQNTPLTPPPVASIPILLLHRSSMQPRQKAALGVFLCLSLVMVAFSITRVSHIRGASGVDVPWVFFWQFAEASVAVLMGSLTVFRTLLVAERERRWSPSPSPGQGGGEKGGKRGLYNTFRQRVRLLGKSSRDLESQTEDGLPEIPGATMTGLRTYIRRNNRDSGVKTNVMVSQHSTLAEEEDSILRRKEKEDRMTEEVRQVTAVPVVPRNPPFAYHYPIWRPQPSHNQGPVQLPVAADPSQYTIWADPAATQTSFGGTTLHERRGS